MVNIIWVTFIPVVCRGSTFAGQTDMAAYVHAHFILVMLFNYRIAKIRLR